MSTNSITAYLLVPHLITLEDVLWIYGVYQSIPATTLVQGIVTQYNKIPDKRHTEIYNFTDFDDNMTLNSRHWHLKYHNTTVVAPSKMHFFLRFSEDKFLNSGAMFQPVLDIVNTLPEGVLEMIRTLPTSQQGRVVSVFHHDVPVFMKKLENVVLKTKEYKSFIRLLIDLHKNNVSLS
jgi:hypothetical protein